MSTDSAGRIRAYTCGLSNPLWSPRMQPLHVSMLENSLSKNLELATMGFFFLLESGLI